MADLLLDRELEKHPPLANAPDTTYQHHPTDQDQPLVLVASVYVH